MWGGRRGGGVTAARAGGDGARASMAPHALCLVRVLHDADADGTPGRADGRGRPGQNLNVGAVFRALPAGTGHRPGPRLGHMPPTAGE